METMEDNKYEKPIVEELQFLKSQIINKENNETQNKYTLSKQDFDKYFGIKTFSQGTGNCYAVSVVDSLQDLDNFEDLIRKNVKRLPDGFIIKLPLDGDLLHQKSYTVIDKDLNIQVSITGKISGLLYEINGYTALLHAVGQRQTGQKDFDLREIYGGNPKEVMSLLMQKYTYYNHYTYMGKENVPSQKGIIKMLKCFEKGKDMLIVYVTCDNDIHTSITNNDMYTSITNHVDMEKCNHALSIERIEKNKKNDIVKIIVSDPNMAGIEFELSLDKIAGIAYGSKRNRSVELSGYEYADNKIKRPDNNGEVISDPIVDIDLNTIIECTKNIDRKLSGERGNVTVRYKNKKVYVNSWGKQDTSITYFHNNTMNIAFNTQTLSLSKEVFSDSLSKELFSDTHYSLKRQEFKKYLYPPRLAVFINKMRHDYIDTKKGGSATPFFLDHKGSLRFDDSILSTNLPVLGRNLLGDTGVTVLKDRSLLGINAKNNTTKVKIRNFLNQLYIN